MPLRRDRKRVTLALTRHLERIEPVNAGGGFEVAEGAFACADRQLAAHRIKADAGGADFVAARRQSRAYEAAGIIAGGGQPERWHFDLCAFEEISCGGIADRASACAGGCRRSDGRRAFGGLGEGE